MIGLPSQSFIFAACPLCESADVAGHIRSIRKDMSVEGFSYAKCRRCGTYYERDVTPQALDAFYGSLGAYESATAKDVIAEDLARRLGLSGRERVLDLGCGSGAWSLPFLRHAAHLTCVDFDPQAIELLRTRVPAEDRLRVSCRASSTLEFLQTAGTGAFDVVLSMFSLEHDLQPRTVLREIGRVLSAGGRAVILVPSGDALQIALLGGGFYWFQAPWHTFVPSRKGMNAAAAAAGFQQAAVFEPTSPFYSWFWLRGFADRWRLRPQYDRLRRFRWFVGADMALDRVLDRISWRLARPSYRFFILARAGGAV